MNPLSAEAATVKNHAEGEHKPISSERSAYKRPDKIDYTGNVIVNPLYADDVNLEQAEKIHAKSIAAMQKEADAIAEDYLTYNEAVVLLRKNMKNRVTDFSFNISFTDSSITNQDGFLTFFSDKLMNDAVAHTGVPNEGDYLCWSWVSYGIGVSGNSDWVDHKLTYTVSFDYMTTASEEAEVTEAVDYVLSELGVDSLSDYDTIGYIYDFICQYVTYDHDSVSYSGDTPSTAYKHAHCAYGAIINGLAVCQGYASLFYRMLLECDIDTRLVASEDHGWNIVELDGIYYDCDTTWDAGETDHYYYFMEGSSWFRFEPSHVGTVEYRNKEFTNTYPVSPLAYCYVSEGVVETASGQCGPNAFWELDNRGVLTIQGTGIIEDYDNSSYTFWEGYEGWIKKIVIEEGITSISDYAFYNCSALEEVSLPETLEYIGDYAFAFCDRLKGLVVPASVTEVGECAFWVCVNLEQIKFKGSAPLFEDYVFAEIETTAYYPSDDSSWTSSVRGQYDGFVTWTAYERSCEEIGHNYMAGEPVWGDSHNSCELTYTCSRCGDSKKYTDNSTNVETIKEADCTEEGEKVYTAEFTLEDGTKKTVTYKEVIPATGHSFDAEPVWRWSEDNTSAAIIFTCSACGIDVTENVEADITIVEPTCTADGKEVYTVSYETEDKTYADKKEEILPMIDHTYEVGFQWASDKTICIANVTCKTCDLNETYNSHIKEVITDPTCTEEGKIEYTTTFEYEGKTYTDTCTEVDTIPATGHSFGEPVFDWTGYTECNATVICQVCKQEEILDCIITSQTTDATCMTEGLTIYTASCDVNGMTYRDNEEKVLPLAEHTYGEPGFTWTGNEECQAVFTCSFEGCGHTETVNCNIQEDKVEPTCTKDGYVGYVATCEFNEKEYKAVKESESIPATGHTYDKEHPEWKWNEDKTEAAVLFYCTGCDETATVVDAEIDFVTTEPTCIEEGLTVYTASCEFEGKEYTDTKEEIIPIVEHNYECSFGWTEDYSACMATYTCLVCGETKTEDCNITSDTTIVDCTTPVIITYTATTSDGKTDVKTAEGEVLGHVYGEPIFAWDGDECTITIGCTRCDFSKIDNCAVELKTVEATCTTEGSVGYIATYEFEGETYTNPREDEEILPPLGHNYVAEPTWKWSDDKTKATAVFPCDRCEEMTTVGVTTVPVTTPATCTEAGKTVYTATVTVPNGTKEYTDTEEVVLPATGHNYKAAFVWTEDLTACTATITCSGCDVKVEKECTVTEKDGVYTATCEYDGQTFTAEATFELPFTDVQEGLWYYDAIQFVYLRGIMTGKGDGTYFAPEENLTRAQFATILYRLEDSPSVEYEAKFPDVSDNMWYTDGIMWAQQNGIVTGYESDGTFRPENNITREQMALMMYRYAKFKGYDTSKAADYDEFADGTKVSPWAEEAMAWAVGNGIITGKDKPEGKLLDPQGEATRAQCATIIQRFLELYE